VWDALREKKLGVRIMLGVVVGILGIGMLLYLVPQGTNDLSASDAVAQVGDGGGRMVPRVSSERKHHGTGGAGDIEIHDDVTPCVPS